MQITNDKAKTKKRIPILGGPNEFAMFQAVKFKEHANNPLGYAFFEIDSNRIARTKLDSVEVVEPYTLAFTGNLLDLKDNVIGQIEGTYNCALKKGLILADY